MNDILNKIRAETPKKLRLLARGREKNPRVDTSAAGELTKLVMPHLPAAVRAWVAGLGANKAIWSKEEKDFIETNVPDHKVRAECALYLIQYAVGKAIDRSMEISGNYKELSDLVSELKQSPEAQRLIAAGFFQSLLSNVEDQNQAPTHEGEAFSQSEPKTG